MTTSGAPRIAVLVAVASLSFACGSSSPTVTPTSLPTPEPAFGVDLVTTSPAAGSTLDLAAPNDTTVALSVTFSVTVPTAQAGTYFWTVAVQAEQPPGEGFIVPVVTTGPLQPVTLAAGTQTVTLSTFHTTNAVCYSDRNRPPVSSSLDVDIKASQAFSAPSVFGRRFASTFSLRRR